jgi:hypothetical protein
MPNRIILKCHLPIGMLKFSMDEAKIKVLFGTQDWTGQHGSIKCTKFLSIKAHNFIMNF